MKSFLCGFIKMFDVACYILLPLFLPTLYFDKFMNNTDFNIEYDVNNYNLCRYRSFGKNLACLSIIVFKVQCF